MEDLQKKILCFREKIETVKILMQEILELYRDQQMTIKDERQRSEWYWFLKRRVTPLMWQMGGSRLVLLEERGNNEEVDYLMREAEKISDHYEEIRKQIRIYGIYFGTGFYDEPKEHK